MSAEHRNWQRDESLLVLHLYCRTPFGKLHKSNPDIIQLAEIIDRTPSAVSMKAVNFAHLDPNLERKGLSRVSNGDRELWAEFLENSQHIALAAEDLFEQRVKQEWLKSNKVSEFDIPEGPTETARQVMTRRVQSFFRKAVLTSYENRCAISGLQLPPLLIASHIIPWKESEERRADPTNGIALNTLYDSAFDKGLLTFDEDWRVCLSSRLKEHIPDSEITQKLLTIEGLPLILPKRFYPDPVAMNYHRNKRYKG